MLEKIGLPPKPSLRGNNWVVDASNCQACCSQFTFINRKHHCRRCGGLFCNSCTQQRMLLRGQGDSPVRICEACKKLEEAARFEKRNGYKNKAGRGGLKLTPKDEEEEMLQQILGNEGKDSISSARASTMDTLRSALQTSSSTSCSNIEDVSTQDGEISRTLSLDHVFTAIGSTNPEELRQQAIEEKNKYKTLKAEGKSKEALIAFKRGKELERQAGALELSLRKNRKKALAFKDDSGTSQRGSKITPPKSDGKNDLASELKELGWSDMDLRDADKRPATLSLEGELSSLLGEVSRKTNTEKRTGGPDKSQVTAHKKRALELKRAGNLAEAKEELKKAKILEKEIEEQELLGEAEDSDDEFASLIRSIDDYKDDDLSIRYDPHSTFEFGFPDDLGVDDNFEVEDEDMNDPEMDAALKSLGWTEDTEESPTTRSQSASIDKEALMEEIQSLKREAVNKKRAGNTAEAMALLKKAKGLEMELDSSDFLRTNDLTTRGPVITQKDSAAQLAEEASGFSTVGVGEVKVMGPKMSAKSKLTIQKELLALKKRALALRREGKLDEAEEELRKGKVLEKQLEEMDKAPKTIPSVVGNKPSRSIAADPEVEDDVTDQDMSDPTYLSLLKNLGWNDDNDENPHSTSSSEAKASADVTSSSATQATANISAGVSRKSKGEIQRELLGLKRKSLALRRQGEVEEAEEVLEMAKSLEAQLAEIETPPVKQVSVEPEFNIKGNVQTDSSLGSAGPPFPSDSKKRPMENVGSRDKATPKKLDETENIIANPLTDSQNDQNTLKEDILAHKRKAVMLKREGKLAEAKDELRQAKLLEKHLEEKAQPSTRTPDTSSKVSSVEKKAQPSTSSPDTSSKVSSVGKKEDNSTSAQKPLTARERFKLQQESLSHKRRSLKLRREGRTEEADAEFELAKALEAQLEESSAHDSAKPSETEQPDDVSIEDFLDPQLMSALKSLGIPDVGTGSQGLEGTLPKPPVASKIDSTAEERKQLEEQIKAEKLKALNLKRSGKQAEAIDALRRAKLYEKKLNSLT